MTTIPSWNIQAGRGVDGRIDLVRIARTARVLADADVIRLRHRSLRANRAASVGRILRRLQLGHADIAGAFA